MTMTTTISSAEALTHSGGGVTASLPAAPAAPIRDLSIDIETYSPVDLTKCGVYKYAEAPDFTITLFGYAVNGGKVRVVDLLQGGAIPEEILAALTDDRVTKWAFNANFERVCLSRFLGLPQGTYLAPESWRCTMVWAAYLGLPLKLKDAGAALGLEKQKIEEGKDLIRYFCVPCAPTAKNGGRTRNLPEHAPDKWFRFKQYNLRDVEVEMAIQQKLRHHPVPDAVWDEYHLDQRINDRGVALDMDLVNAAIRMDDSSRKDLTARMQKITELENPNSVQQLRMWLSDNGLEMETLGKKAVAEQMKTAPEDIYAVLRLRQQLAKSSVKKYIAMQNAVCADGRARGMFQFYGANRTGRFSGRNVQLQNLPQNHLPDLEGARNALKTSGYETMQTLYDDVPDTLSQLIRTAFVPRQGRKFIVADFSAIEARVLSWIAGEEWRTEVFRSGGDIYCASASQMFGVPVEKHGQNAHLRQKGKIAELALGYGGSVGALKAMGALEMGLTEAELPELVSAWRDANPHITEFWWAVDAAVKEAITKRDSAELGCLTFTYRGKCLYITLPSGRQLVYARPRLEENDYGGHSVTYFGVGQNKKWCRLESYGPKFTENIIQAISRDILCYAMMNLRRHDIVMHIHDEVVIDAPPELTLEEVCSVMGQTPPWTPGLLLRADGYECDFYKKD